jgi:hypothetical protein
MFAAAMSSTLAHAQSPEAYRGQLLYESTCTQCHAESVHGRKQRIAQSFDDIRWYITRWSKAAGKAWSADDIHDVAVFLNERYYKFRCDLPNCKRESASVPPKKALGAAAPGLPWGRWPERSASASPSLSPERPLLTASSTTSSGAALAGGVPLPRPPSLLQSGKAAA